MIKHNRHINHMFLLFPAIIFCLSIATISFGQEQKLTWENGQVKAEGSLENGYKKGEWTYYRSNGSKEAVGSYLPEESSRTYSIVKRNRKTAVDDEKSTRHGKWTYFYSNGQKKAEAVYENGCPTGTLTKWYPNGNKFETFEYIDCKPLGDRKTWHEDGWLQLEILKEEGGKSTRIEYYDNSQKKSITPYRNGQQYGRVTHWYKNGSKKQEVMMKNAKVHGAFRSWHENGQIKMSYFSINNVMSGEYNEWAEDGQVLWSIVELSDSKVIDVKQYWNNGQIKLKGKSALPRTLSIHHWTQSRNGYWIYYYRDGTVKKSEKYDRGRLVNVVMP